MAGYIGTQAVSVNTTSATITGDASIGGDLSLGDSDKAIFGAGSDLQIHHDGSNSYVTEVGAGALVLQSNGTAIVLEKSDGENMILANTDGAVTLYFNGAAKLATKATGVTVTGEMAATTMDLSSNAVIDGTLSVGSTVFVDAPLMQVRGIKNYSGGISRNMLTVIDNQAHSVTSNGGAIAFGGSWNSGNDQTSFAQIEGAKNNNTSGNYGGKMILSVRQHGNNMYSHTVLENNGDLRIGQNLVIGTAGKGVDFAAQTASGATGVSSSKGELLDHYEQGAFTPIFQNSGGEQINYAFAAGFYVRVGARVHAHGYIGGGGNAGNTGTSNDLQLGGLPFDAVNVTNGHASVNFGYGANLNIAAGVNVTGYLGPNTTLITVQKWSSAVGTTNLTFGELSTDGRLMFSLSYNAV